MQTSAVVKIIIFKLSVLIVVRGGHYDEEAAENFLTQLDNEVRVECNHRALKDWSFANNLTRENQIAAAAASLNYSKFWKRKWDESRKFNWRMFKEGSTKRQLKIIQTLGMAILPEEKLSQYNTLKLEMEKSYSSAKVCNDLEDLSNCTMVSLEPEIMDIFAKSRDEKLLKYVWTEWRNKVGRSVKQNYKKIVPIIQEASKLNNFNLVSEYDTRLYDSNNFKAQIETLWAEMEDFYKNLHAYVRSKLKSVYGKKVIKTDMIPAHLLGNPWAQTWNNIYDIVMPYNESNYINTVNENLQDLSGMDMARIAQGFFVSMNMSEFDDSFWDNSVFTKPEDRDIICHASAWDMCDGEDFRIKQCTRPTLEDLVTLHHEMGHTMYQMLYKDLPKIFRDGANPGFHEAIGDLIALSVQTPQHLSKIKLLDQPEDDNSESDINYLMSMALEKIAFLPFGLLLDFWRWDIFDGKVSPSNYNCHWWTLREKYQGITAPVKRSEADFDPGAKFHVVSNNAYIRYFVSTIIQFQFHMSLCITAEQYNPADPNGRPLHKCDLFNSHQAGIKLSNMLRLGSSRPWPEAMEIMTGQRDMSANAILEYFRPLIQYLKNANKLNNETVGWKTRPGTSMCANEKNGGNDESILPILFIMTLITSTINLLNLY